MNIVHCFLVGTIICMVSHPIECGPSKSMNGRKVVLMSMDGFRYDYLTKFKGNFSNFEALIASGVKVPYVNNVFSTLTFPSHCTIVTGRYEESHGIIANQMYDPVFKAYFSNKVTETRWWNGAEPIWTNAVKSGLKVGTFFWPGSEAEVAGTRPNEWRSYNDSVPFEERVDTVVKDWLVKGDFDFGVIYFDEPDKSGHEYGPDDPRMIPVLERMDRTLGYFLQKLKEENLTDKVDFIITSDHGMTNINRRKRLIVLRDYVDDTLIKESIGYGAITNIIPQDGKAEELVRALSNISHMAVYLKEDLPDRYHYKNHRRVMPVVAVAEEGWEVSEKSTNISRILNQKGNHGYDNTYMSMKPIFIATGPSFKNGGAEVKPIKSVDIYPLLCRLMNLEEAPNNGSFERVKPLLRGANDAANISTSFSTFGLLLFAILLFKET